MVVGYQMLEASMDRSKRNMDELMIIVAKRYLVSVLAELLYREYSNSIIQQKRPVLVIVRDSLLLGNDVAHRTL